MKKQNFDPVQLKTGNYLSEVQFYKIIERGPFSVRVVNERGLEFSIGIDILLEGAHTNNQYTETKKVTKTELSKILMNCHNVVFSATFQKQIKEKEILELVKTFNQGQIMSTEDMVKAMRLSLKGETRDFVGYLVESDHGMGRSLCVDLEKKFAGETSPLILIDHRTLKSIIVKNVKYIVK